MAYRRRKPARPHLPASTAVNTLRNEYRNLAMLSRILAGAVVLLALSATPPDAAELKIATWNLEWLTARPAGDLALPPDVVPKSTEDIARLRAYAERLAADVVAVQEVDGPAVLARVFPPERYVLHLTHDSVVQRVGFAVRRGLAFTANPDLTALDLYPDATHRLRSGADITLDLPGGRLRLLSVHLKSGCRQDRLASSPRRECATLRARPDVAPAGLDRATHH
jgi:endonuclease/exonuclease/phosphatase family metal-dependent hydrolase